MMRTPRECYDNGFSVEQAVILTGQTIRSIERRYVEYTQYYISIGKPSNTEIIADKSLKKIKLLEIELFSEIEKAKQGLKNKAKYLQLIYSQSLAQY